MDKLGVCTSRHVRTVSLVVTLIDDFTGRTITGSNARVWIDGAKPPIKKAEGWNVFVNLPAGEHTIHAEGGFYNKTAFVCRVFDGTYTAIKLRLTPSKNAPLASDAASVEGKTLPGGMVWLRPDDRALSYKLLTDAKAGEQCVGIYHPDGIDIEGKLFCIRSGDDEEYVRVCRADADGQVGYRLDMPLSRDYPKIGTLVYPVSECCAGERGEFFIPIRSLPDRGTVFICRLADGKVRELTLAPGRRIRLED
ncbi:MAG: hypothetical protein E7632_02070 [Ruminococcaceae bacterium]|nr:hypothetical protein [Oscillospiraceae bacterium]